MADSTTVQNAPPSPSEVKGKPFSRDFLDSDNAQARRVYLKVLITGCLLIVLTIFAVLAIYWGALWRTPVRNLRGWVIDFDLDIVGQSVVRDLTTRAKSSKVTFTAIPATRFPGGPSDLVNVVREEKTWVAIAIDPGSSDRLRSSYSSPNVTYNGTDAMTVYASEARNENAYRYIIRPSYEASLESLETSFATQAIQLFATSANINLPSVIATSPQTIVKPISYKTVNVAPFNIAVASAVTFVGLIYMLILSFFVVMTAYGARAAAGFENGLTLHSLIITRLMTYFITEFFISLSYSLLSLAFLLDFSRKFKAAGFIVFWMINYVGMLSVGLALEALIPLLTNRYIPFFMIVWVIVNVSVCIQPIEVLPSVYRYGYASPFYNISRAVRCVVFATRNQLGLNFGVLFVWIIISCISLLIIQWFVRRREVIIYRQKCQNRTNNEQKRIPTVSDDGGNEERRA
ncbi:hypothetical protein FPV67DRAFT_1408627 [Lyophyllum atratum]|nr:hypothetical protein FPV67DRAFT_1408627 [Lyophyllum atratum]